MWIKSSWSQNVDEMNGITQNKKKWTDFDVCWKCWDYFIVCRYNSALQERKRRRRSTKKMFIQKKWKKVGQMLPNAISPSNNKTEFIFVSIIANRDEKKTSKRVCILLFHCNFIVDGKKAHKM